MPTPTGIDVLDTTVVPAMQAVNFAADPNAPDTTPLGDAGLTPSTIGNTLAPTMDAIGNGLSNTAEMLSPSALTMTPTGMNAPEKVADREALKDAAAAHVLGVDTGNDDGEINAPIFDEKKVGTSKTETTQNVANADAVTAQADLTQADVDAKAASKAEIEAQGKMAEVEANRQEADTKAVAQVETARAITRSAKTAEIEKTLSDIDTKVAELSNYKPEAFWGSKSTSDKIAASISVGLGSFAQSLTGSGQNVGTMLLGRQMDEFDSNQKALYANKIEQIKQMRTGVDEKEKLIDQMDKTFDAQKLAARAQVSNLYARQAIMAKTPMVQAAIAKAQATFDQTNANLRAQIADKYATKIQSTEERDVEKIVQRQAGKGPDNKPLTSEQTKARIAYSDMLSTIHVIKHMDIDKIASTPEFQKYLDSVNLESKLGQAPMVGGALSGLGDAAHGTNMQALAKANPEAARAANAMDNWTRGVIRYKSGAAIAHSEQNEERNQYWPVLGDTPEIVKDKAASRKNLEKAMRQAGALE